MDSLKALERKNLYLYLADLSRKTVNVEGDQMTLKTRILFFQVFVFVYICLCISMYVYMSATVAQRKS